MPQHFNSKLTYKHDRDVRDHSQLLQLLREWPHGQFWALVAPRRHGKTWALKALEYKLRDDQDVKYLELGDAKDAKAFMTGKVSSLLLLDEPGRWFSSRSKLSKPKAEEFLRRCDELREDKVRVFAAMTPREFEFLHAAKTANSRNDLLKDLQYLRPLTRNEGHKMAQRVSWAQDLWPNIPPLWKRSPFLLELLLEIAEQDEELRKNSGDLVRAAILASRKAPSYLSSLYYEGLSDRQRKLARDVAWQENPNGDVLTKLILELLEGSGLLLQNKDEFQVADPVLADHLPPPLRIHHISDIHVGEKAAHMADVKMEGQHGAKLAKALDSLVRDDYLNHVKSLRDAKPHLVIVSGDIAERGDAELYAEVKGWFEKLEQQLAEHPKLESEDPRVLVVGGNHDVDWNAVLGTAGTRKRHLPFARAFADYPRPRLEEPPDKRKLACVEYADANLAICLLGSAEFGGDVEDDPAWQRMIDLVNELRLRAVNALEAEDWEKTSRLLDNVARIDPGLVHPKDLVRLRSYKRRLPVKIAVLHHPVSPLPYTEVARFAGLMNAGEVKDALFASKFCLALQGHMHVGWFACETWPGQHDGWTLRVAAAATLGSRETAQHHGFNEIAIYSEGERCELVVRRLGREGRTWTEQAKMGPFTPGE